MRKLPAIIVVLLVLALLPASAGAITNGEVDVLEEFPFVGMLAFYDADDAYMHRCSGTLMSPTVIVTASHCTDGTSRARAYFNLEVEDNYRTAPSAGMPGTPQTHPEYNPRTLSNDVAVVVLDAAAGYEGPFPTLPTEGMLSDLKAAHEIQDDWFVAAGYGGQTTWPPPVLEFDLLRRYSTSPYGGLTRNNLHLQQNPKPTGAGGTCFGDSGGPRLWGERPTLVAVTSWGDAICRSNDMAQRLDIPSTLDFLSGYLPDA